MLKNILLIVGVVFFSGCSHFRISGTMCDRVASDPLATIPTECRNYNEKDAEKASRVGQKILTPEEIISFEKE